MIAVRYTYAMIQRRAKSGGITTRVGNHTFRATGVSLLHRDFWKRI